MTPGGDKVVVYEVLLTVPWKKDSIEKVRMELTYRLPHCRIISVRLVKEKSDGQKRNSSN